MERFRARDDEGGIDRLISGTPPGPRHPSERRKSNSPLRPGIFNDWTRVCDSRTDAAFACPRR